MLLHFWNAVFSMLERAAGCHWLAAGQEKLFQYLLLAGSGTLGLRDTHALLQFWGPPRAALPAGRLTR